jgi:hypothetical protein
MIMMSYTKRMISNKKTKYLYDLNWKQNKNQTIMNKINSKYICT